MSTLSNRTQQLGWYFRKHWKGFLGGAFFLVVTNLFALRIPREIGLAIQRLKDADSGVLNLESVETSVVAHAHLIILLAVGAAVTRILSRITVFNSARRIEYDLRNHVFTHLTTLSPSYFQSMPTGDLTSRVINDTTYVRLLFGVGFLHTVNTAVAAVLAASLMLGLEWRLTLFCLAPFPFFVYFVAKLVRAIHVLTRRIQEKMADLTAQVQEDLSGIAVIKTYGIEAVEAERFGVGCEQFVQENLKLAKVRSYLFPIMMSIGGLGSLLVLYLGGRAVIVSQTIGLGEFIEFSGYIALLTWPLIGLGWVISVYQRGTAAFDRLLNILEASPDIVAPAPEEAPEPIASGLIEFEGVSFDYGDGSPNALTDINLVINSGQRLGIVGPSGSGKTTLLNLIARLHDPTEGVIRIDGRPLTEIPLQTLRAAIGYAPQEPFLFSTTLENNIRFGFDVRQTGEDSDDPIERLRATVQLAQLEDDLKAFPDGLETMVGERGITLSGGQRQRAALARGVITDPIILMLDDSLSSVDTRTERAIIEQLKQVLSGRTSILVTHRFNVLELLDEVVVLENGRITERGPHGDLMKAGGSYARMVERQRLREEISAL